MEENDTEQVPAMFDTWLAAAEKDHRGITMMTLRGTRQLTSAAVLAEKATKRFSLGE